MQSELIDFPLNKRKVVDDPTGGDGGNRMLERVAKLESDVEYIKRDVAEIKSDLKSAKTDISAIKQDLAVLKERSENFATKSDVESLRTEIYKTKAELLSSISAISRSIWIPLAIGLALWAIKIFFIK
ncbi:hypothetical protein [Pectobacterium sp. CHL-2024]|uniref:hypothetical protein n=1 Tax=Pectobacterium sp. CHL-2024 TaxID=3377079 RepID=UPI00381C81D6